MQLRDTPRLFALIVSMLLTACAATTADNLPQAAGGAATPRADADKLLVVDCLLPGQIRKLGQVATYLTPRRPIKTSAGDCEIRGGEYVAYDRANYATALKVWLPPAQAGDAVAQTYVGEIYERGLGVAPDYALAAQWYRKAAEQGNSRAQVDLGALYEQGLGVQKDPVTALNWYRRASGLTGDQLAFSSSIEQLKSQRQTADQEVALRRQEAERLRRQMQQTQRQLDAQSKTLKATQQELERTRRELQKQRSAPATSTPGTSAAVEDLQRRLAEQQAQLEQQTQKVGFLQQEAGLQQAQLTAELRATQRREEALKQNVATQAAEKESLQQQVTSLQQQLGDLQGQLDSRNQELAAQKSSLQQTQDALDREKRINEHSAEILRLEAQLGERNAQLAKTQGQVEALKAAVELRQGKLQSLQSASAEPAERGGSPAPSGAVSSTSSPGAGLDFGRYYALIIGNDRYASFPNLQTAVSDAQAVAKVLETRYGFTTRVLTNATRYEILAALNEFREKLTDKDNFLLYYAGHGELDKVNARGNWLPVDAEPNSTANWIPNYQITDILNSMNAKHVMVIADSCYSGTLARSVSTSIEGGRSSDKQRAWLKLMIDTRSRTVLTSGGLAPVLDSGGGGDHSVFAKFLLQVLQTNKSVLEGPLLYREVAERVKAAAARLDVNQDPQYAPIKFAGDLGAPFFFAPVS